MFDNVCLLIRVQVHIVWYKRLWVAFNMCQHIEFCVTSPETCVHPHQVTCFVTDLMPWLQTICMHLLSDVHFHSALISAYFHSLVFYTNLIFLPLCNASVWRWLNTIVIAGAKFQQVRNQLGTPGGAKSFWEGPNFLNYVQ